jgi:hypothetical protein
MPTFVSDQRIVQAITSAVQLPDPSQIPQFLRTQGIAITDFALVTRKTLQGLITYLKSQGFQVRPTDRHHSLISVLTEWIEGEWQKEARQAQVKAQLKAQEQAHQARQAYQARQAHQAQAKAQEQAYQAHQAQLQAQEQARQAREAQYRVPSPVYGYPSQAKKESGSWW